MASTSEHRVSEPPDLSGPMLKFLVGNRQQPRYVHESVLDRSSAKLGSAVKARRHDDDTTIELANHTLEAFHIYMNWLYCQRIPDDDPRSHHTLDHLAEAYITGYELKDNKFKNAVIDRFIDVSRSENALPRASTVDIIYEGTSLTCSSPARRLLVDIYALFFDSAAVPDVKTHLGRYPKAFLVDVLDAITKVRPMPRESGDLMAVDGRKYYETETR
ncbi:hypothetical protein BDV96DRAFT_639842 [Lophiotrema nucula]|uniref:BTB domain-containing protein n=1 Tax=Lophiotrema nucula TaxID=690887 RepID=A0A6A5ZRJ5_9PLEO|nr:hypothetical protein BDV96DRAFT_639842 [Lophiotrema nucula]